MEQITPGAVHYHKGFAYYMLFENGIAQQVFLYAERGSEDWTLVLAFHPGDTMRQAKRLYPSLQLEKLVALVEQPGWTARPNFHIAFRASNLVWSHAKIQLQDYVAYWQSQASSLAQLRLAEEQDRSRFLQHLETWQNLGIVPPEQKGEFFRETVETRRKAINVCPGISLFHRWSAERAKELDARGELVDDVRAKLTAALAVWGQSATAA